jgi:adenylate cyclase
VSRLAQFRQRKLVQWVLAYVAAAFAMLQLLDLLSNVFEWPAWIMRAVTVVLGLGVAAVGIIAWYHGEKGEQRIARVEIVLLGLLVIGAGVTVRVTTQSRSEDLSAGAGSSVLVLPFSDMSPGNDQQYFADGISEEILNTLAQLPGLHVPARTSSFSLKTRNLSVGEMAQQLGVTHVLEGSVRKSGDKVRITAQLIDARRDRHVWSQEFDRDLNDIFAVQAEIARSIVDALQVRMTDRTPIAAETGSGRAHELYLKGLYHWNRRHGDELLRAIDYFEQAANEDVTYARAYTGLALTYAVLPQWNAQSSVSSSIEKGKAAAVKALRLNPRDANAHAALGQIAQELEWDWVAAQYHYDRAVALDPNNATVLQWRGELWQILGRFEESLQELNRALSLDPLSRTVRHRRASALQHLGRHDEAFADMLALFQEDPTLEWAPFDVLFRAGRYEQAARFLAADDPFMKVLDGLIDSRKKQQALRALGTPEMRRTLAIRRLARAYALLGELDSAATIYNRAANGWALQLPWAANDPESRVLQNHPQFKEFRQKVHL